MVAEENLKKPRYAFEYGVYDREEEVKIQQWVKPNPKKKHTKYDETVQKMLFDTFTGKNFEGEEKDPLMDLFGEDYLETD